jgi:hypothetical protein
MAKANKRVFEWDDATDPNGNVQHITAHNPEMIRVITAYEAPKPPRKR